MNESIATTVQASSWTQLSYFKVFVHNDSQLQNPRYPLLNNGNQQVLVTVRLAAQDARGNYVAVSAADLNSIRLIDYGTSEAIYFGSQLQPWSTSQTDMGFIWDRSFLDSIRSLRLEQPELFEQADRDPGAFEHALTINDGAQEVLPALPSVPVELQEDCGHGYQCFRFYLRTTSTISRRFAARITNSDNTVFRSNYAEVADDNGEGDGRGKFNSSFEINPISFPRLPSESYGDRLANGYLKDTPIGDGVFTGKYRAFEHHINIRMPGGRAVPIKTIPNFDDSTGVVWGNGGSGRSKLTITYIGLPGSDTTRYTYAPYYMKINKYGLGMLAVREWMNFTGRGMGLEGKIKYPRSGELVVGQVLCEENFWFYTNVTASKEVLKQTTKDITVVDIYGTLHDLRIGLIPEYNYLTLERR